MPRFAPVAPVGVLRRLKELNSLGSYHLLLAHDVLEHLDAYRNVFSSLAYHPIKTIIMDNSVVELGEHCSIDTVLPAVYATSANVIVLPDVYMKGPESLEATKGAYNVWAKACKDLSYDWSFMVVPQGRNFEEWIECARALSMSDLPKVGWWGVPRNFRSLGISRSAAVGLCQRLQSNWQIHMLGFSDDPQDDIYTARTLSAYVVGIDSAVPLRIANDPINMSFYTYMDSSMPLPPRKDWYGKAVVNALMLDNLHCVRQVLHL